MTAVLERPEVLAAPAPSRRPGLPRLLAAAGAALLAGAGVLAVPASSGAVVTGPPVVSPGGPSLTTLEAYGPVGSHVVGYQHALPVTLRLPVRNDGPLPVTVEGGTLDDHRLPLLDLAVDAPVELGPGESGELVLRGALDHCRYYHEREVQVYRAVHLQQSVLGLPADRVVPLDRPVLVHSPMIVGCPDRRLDRQADDRRDGFRPAARS